MTTVKDIVGALQQKAGYTTLSVEEKPNKLTLMGRQPPGNMQANWRLLRGYLWLAANGKKSTRPWKVDISCVYFVAEEVDGVQRYAWRLIFTAPELQNHYRDICSVIGSSPLASPRGLSLDEMEVPLPGASAKRNSPEGGRRGAGPIGTVAVGPLALAAKMRGG